MRVTSDSPTLMELVDDGKMMDEDPGGGEILEDIFEKEHLHKLPSKYTKEDLVVRESLLRGIL